MQSEWLDECRNRLGQPPRSFGWWEKWTYLKIKKPAWVPQDPTMSDLFAQLPKLMTEGDILPGHIVQANSLLFAPGKFDCPAEIVHPESTKARLPEGYLSQVAHELFELKGTEPSEMAHAEIAEFITDELSRPVGRKVPGSIAKGPTVLMSVIFISRRHLPNGILSQSDLPLLVLPTSPRYVMVLPSRFWPAEMIAWWQE